MKLRRRDVIGREVGHVVVYSDFASRGLKQVDRTLSEREKLLSNRPASFCVTRRQFAGTTLAGGAVAALLGPISPIDLTLRQGLLQPLDVGSRDFGSLHIDAPQIAATT